MTAIERTAYPRFTRAPSVKELRDIYSSNAWGCRVCCKFANEIGGFLLNFDNETGEQAINMNEPTERTLLARTIGRKNFGSPSFRILLANCRPYIDTVVCCDHGS
ncbi:hypothetical protein [Dictyobacter arantiisoli]|uniref:Uncharacterized protein n=1 Tax=Dictyobacter arantiisoli TaxID=2014874 RepID=A0A5A5T6D5_9CHLR|nr:hypothetical protein [Dictyobacter arantiisoli]GCF06917.1 hypothetical protein KDI_04810 [Dictyobacter arantiisoli]